MPGTLIHSAIILHSGCDSSVEYFVAPEARARGWNLEIIDTAARSNESICARLDNVQCLVLVRYWPVGVMWRSLMREAKRNGLFCIYFMDDDLFNWKGFRPLPLGYAWKLYRNACIKQRAILSWADQVWVSSSVLAERYQCLNPYLVPLKPSGTVSSRTNAIVIAYHGSGCHKKELEWLYPILQNIQQRYAHTIIELYGDQSTFRMYASLARARVHRPLPWPRYKELAACQQIDIMLCPLLDHSFNTARAAVKFFDAVRVGAAGLYSRREPYVSFVRHECDGILLDDEPAQWLSALDCLIGDHSLRLALAARAMERVSL